ncbi:CpsB/CapC family capsule biosynthesis tyrosine phosphatase [Lentibacillus sp. N15]|uniref:tyrosine-protein phosphatase n=1 Tax=Lentibacillus songyuanensis TaxID=3136161 RepID=UPI0031BBC447
MIDIHCHILPGIDDGAQTIEDSLAMAEDAVNQGIHTIIATPHHQNGRYTNVKLDILTYVKLFNERLQEENIPLTILPGQETRINGEVITELENNIVLPLNETSKYVFVEFPSSSVPRYSKQMLFDIQVAGYTPIIVHPERNQAIAEHPSLLYEFVQKGALSQVTAASLVGKFGKTIQKFSHQLVEANLAHVIASDAHNTTTRGFALSEAYQAVQDQHGSDAFYMFVENAQFILDNQNLIKYEPEPVKRKKILGIF